MSRNSISWCAEINLENVRESKCSPCVEGRLKSFVKGKVRGS